VVSLDFQNVYRRARATFCTHGDPRMPAKSIRSNWASWLSGGTPRTVSFSKSVSTVAVPNLPRTPVPMRRTCVSAPRTSRGAPARGASSRGPCDILGTGLRGGIWCHWLHEADYASVADPTDYTTWPNRSGVHIWPLSGSLSARLAG